MSIVDLLKKDIVILDGGFGTMIQAYGADPSQVPEVLNITNPELIQSIQKAYIEAGSDIIYTCSFGLGEEKIKQCGYSALELMTAAVDNAKEAVSGTDVKIGLDIGPLGRLLEPNGTLPFDQAYEMFKRQILAGKGTDLIVLETMTDLYEMKAALLAAKENSDLPVLCSMTFEENGRTFTGSTIASSAMVLTGLGADAIGINCSLGPKHFIPMIKEMSKWTDLPLLVKPNAGLPNPTTGEYSVKPVEFASYMKEMIPYGVKFVGGCCGTTPDYIREISTALDGEKYSKPKRVKQSGVCSPEQVVIIDQPRIIGERINPTGKKKLKEALKAGDFDYVLDMAVKEVDEGAEILDVNAGVPGIDEKETILKIIKSLQGVITVPVQVDSNNPEVIEAALRVYSGKAIVNSVNGEEKSLSTILPLVKKYGAAVVGLTLDEDGIPKTVEKRMEIANRILERAVALGIPKEDVFIDCLTLTVSAEQENAQNTLLAIRRVKEELGLKTVLGVSNISFGLPARPIVNSNFLQMALSFGLDLPIMNPGAADMIRAMDVHKLIMNMDKGAEHYIQVYKDWQDSIPTNMKGKGASSSNPSEPASDDPLMKAMESGMENTCRNIVREALKTKNPLDIINDMLIPILDKAGKDFETGRIFIPQLITCANSAKAAFDVIKDYIQSSGQKNISKGTILVATVKGDVHDIGKNIVKVILENYGYDIVDMGKDVEPEQIVKQIKQDKIKLVGLSALMTTTLGSMEKTIELIREAALDCKVMVGGAVLTSDYAEKIGADFYVKDAKESVNAAKKIFD